MRGILVIGFRGLGEKAVGCLIPGTFPMTTVINFQGFAGSLPATGLMGWHVLRSLLFSASPQDWVGLV